MQRPERTSAAPEPEAPRFALGWAALVYALLTLALAYPALGGQFLVNPNSDQYMAGYAFRELAATTLKTSGQIPQWNPYLYAGLPYVAAMHGDIFYPTLLLRWLLPVDVAMTWGFIVHVFLAGVFSFAFLRAWGFSFFPSLIGGAAYMLGGNVAGLVSPGHDGKLFVSAMLPLALLLILRLVRDGRLWAVGAFALVVGLAVLSPHPQLLQYMLLACGAFALFVGLTDTGHGVLSRRLVARRLLLALAAIVVGGLIGAVQYYPVMGYVGWSPRAGGAGWEHAISYSMPPEELINTFLPQFSGMLEQYWGRNSIHLHSEYIGATVIVIATLAFGRAVTGPTRRWVWFWTGALGLSLIWALGGFTPFYHIIYAIVPGTKFFRAPSTMLYVVQFSSAMLATVGADRLLRGEASLRRALIWLGVAGLVAILATAGGLTNLAATIAQPFGRADLVYNNTAALAGGAWRSFGAVALLVAIVLAGSREMLTGARLAWALLVLVAVDLWSIERSYWMFSRPAREIFASNPAVEYLKKLPEPGRVLALPLADLGQRDTYLRTANLMVHRVRDALGYHGNEIGRYQQLYQANGALANPNFWQLANVQYWLTNAPEMPFPGTQRVLGPVTDASGTPLYLFKLGAENPYAWVAPAILKAPDEQVFATILDPRFNVASLALFDPSSSVAGQKVTAQPAPLAIKAHATRYEPGRVSIELDAPAPAGSALVVSETYYPGWRATVDGKAATVDRADYAFMGVPLSAGARRIDLEFADSRYPTGKAITFVALAVSLLAWAGGWVIGRRRPDGA
jgi:membrane protein YfhO